MEEKIVHYEKEDLKVIWKPQTCIHAEKCWRGLPEVFKPKDKPWIQPEGADSEKLINQIKQCPSGALSYEVKGRSKDENQAASVKVKLIENGPMMITGELEIEDAQGNLSHKDKAAFCRCGASENKPFCDGSHKKIDFIG